MHLLAVVVVPTHHSLRCGLQAEHSAEGTARCHRWRNAVKRAKSDGIKAYFFVDLLVFPTPVLAAWQNATTGDGKTVAWNDATRQLLKVLVQETFARFPGCDGWIVRTGETYTYDTPYHVGNTPNPGKTAEVWVDFIKFLRDEVCAGQGKDLFFRGWDNWPSTADYYQQMTDQIEPHSQLYFSIKHSAGDFTRPAQWNPQLGVGKHAQIVEVELQREYEGKASCEVLEYRTHDPCIFVHSYAKLGHTSEIAL